MGRNKEQSPGRAKRRAHKQVASILDEEETRDAPVPTPEPEPAPGPPTEPPAPATPPVTARRSLFSRKPPAKPASDLPPLKRLERVVNPVRHSAHITPTVDEMFDTWMREHGVKFIPAVEGLVRAVLQEDDEYKDRVADFTARHGRLPSPDEVPRGPIHQALRPQLEELAKGGV